MNVIIFRNCEINRIVFMEYFKVDFLNLIRCNLSRCELFPILQVTSLPGLRTKEPQYNYTVSLRKCWVCLRQPDVTACATQCSLLHHTEISRTKGKPNEVDEIHAKPRREIIRAGRVTSAGHTFTHNMMEIRYTIRSLKNL